MREFGRVSSHVAPPEARTIVAVLGGRRFVAFDLMSRDERSLGNCKKKRQWKYPPNFERDPNVRRGVAPNDFVQDRQNQKERCPAQCKGPPCLIGQVQGLAEHEFDEQAAVKKS